MNPAQIATFVAALAAFLLGVSGFVIDYDVSAKINEYAAKGSVVHFIVYSSLLVSGGYLGYVTFNNYGGGSPY